MERLYKQSIGSPIIADDIKAPVAILRDFVVDCEKGKIVALVVNKRRNLIVTEQDISGYEFFPRIKGDDCIIEGVDVVRVYEIQKKGLFLIGNRVVTEKGKYLGVCEDFSFDDTEFRIKKIFVSRRILHFFSVEDRIIPLEDIVEVKKSKIIVKDDLVAEKQTSMVGA
ncbi:MAG: PRC-barrel domain-containing protein [Candidatus Gracilibacteria bacterium]|jgi:sporulation protein YlmC with PRC-barrel domain|nr:PRC-barrel domain-containing protein [Candidatus Gracilibacteria bacterium]